MENIFLAEISLYQLVLFFFIYAFCGWCLEVIYAMIETGRFINKGFFSGPVCPIYGVGCILIIICLKPVRDNLLLLFLGSVLLTSMLEFITGMILEKIFHSKWWDYSNIPFNIKGYICLKFSLAWGTACLLVVRVIHPLVVKGVESISIGTGYAIIGASFAAFAVDSIITINSILKLKQKIREFMELSEKLRARMKETSSRISETISGEISDLKERIIALPDSNPFKKSRILKAFPDLQNIFRVVKRELLNIISKGE